MRNLIARAVSHWLASRRQPAGLESLFTTPCECPIPIPIPNCEACRPDPLDPGEVGRQAIRGENILEAVAWLRSQGWQDDAGYLQQYATFLLRARADYERQGAPS